MPLKGVISFSLAVSVVCRSNLLRAIFARKHGVGLLQTRVVDSACIVWWISVTLFELMGAGRGRRPGAHVGRWMACQQGRIVDVAQPIPNVGASTAYVDAPIVHVGGANPYVEGPMLHVGASTAYVEDAIVYVGSPIVHVDDPT